MTQIQSRWSEQGHGRLHYLEAGQRGQPAVMFLHGASFSAETWRQIGTVEQLAGEGFHAVAVDLPGYGKSSDAELRQESWLAETIERLGLRRPAVVSPSMSGQVALPLLATSPQRVSAWVAVAPVKVPGYVDALADLSIPVLAIWGEHDNVVPPAVADQLVERLPNARKVVIPGAGHAPYMNDAPAFHDALLAFLHKEVSHVSRPRGRSPTTGG